MLLLTSNLDEEYYTLQKECIFQKVLGESSMDAYMLTYVNRQAIGICCRELKSGLCNNLEGWDGEGDGREVQKGGDICIPMADSCGCLTEHNKIL